MSSDARRTKMLDEGIQWVESSNAQQAGAMWVPGTAGGMLTGLLKVMYLTSMVFLKHWRPNQPSHDMLGIKMAIWPNKNQHGVCHPTTDDLLSELKSMGTW